MQVFHIGPIMEQIQAAIMAEQEPDPALVNLLVEEGPKAIEEWWDAIANIEAEATALETRIKELEGRKAAREQSIKRMKGALQDILDRHFDGKIKTATLTTWTQRTPSYEFEAPEGGFIPARYWVTPEPRLDKKALIADHKAGVLPESVRVVESSTVSVRLKR